MTDNPVNQCHRAFLRVRAGDAEWTPQEWIGPPRLSQHHKLSRLTGRRNAGRLQNQFMDAGDQGFVDQDQCRIKKFCFFCHAFIPSLLISP
jgi:hypothetical protein